ncbi:unnamed protein product, partial [Symbiodinium sp. CCMP2456]
VWKCWAVDWMGVKIGLKYSDKCQAFSIKCRRWRGTMLDFSGSCMPSEQELRRGNLLGLCRLHLYRDVMLIVIKVLQEFRRVMFQEYL